MKEKVVHYANEALNKFGLTNDEIAVYIEGLVNRSYGYLYRLCGCVIVDHTVSDDTLAEQCSSRSGYNYSCGQHCYLCFALKGLKIGLHWDGQNDYDGDGDW